MKNILKSKLYKKQPIFLVVLMYIAITTVNAQKKSDSDELDKTKVCMVDDEYKGEQQLITVIDNKTYYGCCEPCIETLNSDSSFRYTKDHFTGKKVDKSNAYIVRKTKESDAIIYFENKKNYQAYITKNKE
mgnify:CR=1 FL=1|tara:strand:- start:6828 stop:7220 length:393 start_codon:yes stop_codon:yes gene_type:complete